LVADPATFAIDMATTQVAVFNVATGERAAAVEHWYRLFGHGVPSGQAVIATLRHRLIRPPGRLVGHAGSLTLRLPPGHDLLDDVLARIRALPPAS
jgi:hypothetical protein